MGILAGVGHGAVPQRRHHKLSRLTDAFLPSLALLGVFHALDTVLVSSVDTESLGRTKQQQKKRFHLSFVKQNYHVK